MNIASLFQGASVIAWLLTFAVIALAIYRAGQRRPLKNAVTTVLIMGVIAIVLTISSLGLVFIRPEERGVVISAVAPNGYREEPLGSGVHWIIPILETVERYRISRDTYTMSMMPAEGELDREDSITARTADGQEIFVDASVIYSINPDDVVQVHIRWQDRYAIDLIRPLARGIIRDAVSQFGVEEVVSTQRAEFVRIVEEEMSARLQENGISMWNFVLRNITFSVEYAASVEQKQIAEQQAQQAQLVVEQRKQEAEQARQMAQGQADAAVIAAEGDAKARIIQAEAEAEALALIAEAIRDNPDLLTYQYISKLAPNIQTMLLPSNSPFIFPFPELTATPGVTTGNNIAPQPTATP